MKKLIPFLIPFLLSGCFSGCSSLLYFPTDIQYSEPKKGGYDYESVDFNSGDGTPLKAWYFKNRKAGLKKPRAVFLYFHGNAQNRSSHFATLLWLLDQGIDFMIFDYRGYGGSGGSPSPKGTVEDGIAALRYLDQRVPKDVPLMVFAQSIGGAIAARSLIETRKETRVRWIVLDSTFDSYEWAGASVLSKHALTVVFQPFAFLLLNDEWAPEGRYSELSPIPLFVMHGDQDQIIDFKLGQKLFKSASEPKEFYRIEGGHHIDSFWAHDGRVKKVFMDRFEKIIAQSWWKP